MASRTVWLATGLAAGVLLVAGPAGAASAAPREEMAKTPRSQTQEERIRTASPVTAEKSVDRADTVTVLEVRPGTRRVTVDTADGPVSYVVDGHTVVRSGAKTIPFTDLQPGDRVAITADAEPALQPPPGGRLLVASEIEVVENPPPLGAPRSP